MTLRLYFFSGTLIVNFLILPNVFAQQTGLTLHDTFLLAVERDAIIAAARFSLQASEQKVPEARSALLPKISSSATLGYNYSQTDITGSPTRRNYDTNNVTLNVSQPLFRLSEIINLQQAQHLTEQENNKYHAALQDLILRVAESYFAVLSASESFSVAKAEQKSFTGSLDRAKATYRVGTTTITDKLEAQARYDLSVANVLASENNYAVALHTLESIIEETPQRLTKLIDNADFSTLLKPQPMKTWVDKTKSNNYEILQATAAYQATQKNMKKLRAQHYPTLDLIGTGNRSISQSQFFGTAGKDITSTQASISLQLTIPLYSGGLTSTRLKQAIADKQASKEQLEAIKRQKVLQTKKNYLAVVNGEQQIKALLQALISSKSALNATQKGVEVGVRTNLDILNSQQLHFKTQHDLTVAKYSYLVNVLKLLASSGELSEPHIIRMSKLLTSNL